MRTDVPEPLVVGHGGWDVAVAHQQSSRFAKHALPTRNLMRKSLFPRRPDCCLSERHLSLFKVCCPILEAVSHGGIPADPASPGFRTLCCLDHLLAGIVTVLMMNRHGLGSQCSCCVEFERETSRWRTEHSPSMSASPTASCHQRRQPERWAMQTCNDW